MIGVLQLSTTFPVWVSDVKTLDDALDMIRAVGELTSTDQLAREMADTIAKGFATLPPAGTGRRTAYCIWKDPWMFAGGDTFIHSMLHAAGFDNAFQDQARYPTAGIAGVADIRRRVAVVVKRAFSVQGEACEIHKATISGSAGSNCRRNLFLMVWKSFGEVASILPFLPAP